MESVIEETANYVRNTLYGESSGHDWWHVYRVWKTAKKIGEKENANMQIVELSALLHDIADWKHHNGDFTVGPRIAKEWLSKFPSLNKETINEVCFIIEHSSFKGKGAKEVELSLEGKILQDADRLDAMGAVGIARTFAFGGKKNKIIYDPNIKPIDHKTEDSYIHNNSPTINHFYEKLLLLKDLMNTNYGKKLAIRRHKFMQEYLNEFYKEWEGEL